MPFNVLVSNEIKNKRQKRILRENKINRIILKCDWAFNVFTLKSLLIKLDSFQY